jgi:hypothetical protein
LKNAVRSFESRTRLKDPRACETAARRITQTLITPASTSAKASSTNILEIRLTGEIRVLM